MSGPRNDGGRDAFDDFFGDPNPSGSTERDPEIDADSEPTQDVEIPGDATVADPTSPAESGPSTSAIPTGAVPEDWWTSDPEPAAASPAWQSAPATHAHAQPQSYPQPTEDTPRRGVSPFGLVAMLVGGVLLGALCVGGAFMAFNQDEDPTASQTTVTETSSETSSDTSTTESSSDTSSDTSTTESSSDTSSDTSTTESSSTSSSSSATRSGELPAGVRTCAGPSNGIAVGRGTDVTSCDFAIAVREAYIAADPDGDVSLEVRSPVTNRSYSMSCSGESVTRCTGGNNAVVVLY